jgi:hypothetical protein
MEFEWIISLSGSRGAAIGMESILRNNRAHIDRTLFFSEKCSLKEQNMDMDIPSPMADATGTLLPVLLKFPGSTLMDGAWT